MGLIKLLRKIIRIKISFNLSLSDEAKLLKNCKFKSVDDDFCWKFTKLGIVINVYDGDTFRSIIYNENKPIQLQFRLMGIDTPELKIDGIRKPTKIKKDKSGNPKKNKKYNEEMIEYCEKKAMGLRARFALLSKITNIKEFQLSIQEIKNIPAYVVDDNKDIKINPILKYTNLSNNTKIVKIEALGNEKYGRTLAYIYEIDSKDKSINEWMIENEFAKQYDGGKKDEFV